MSDDSSTFFDTTLFSLPTFSTFSTFNGAFGAAALFFFSLAAEWLSLAGVYEVRNGAATFDEEDEEEAFDEEEEDKEVFDEEEEDGLAAFFDLSIEREMFKMELLAEDDDFDILGVRCGVRCADLSGLNINLVLKNSILD